MILKTIILSTLICLSSFVQGQSSNGNNTLLWEISGNGLEKSSYLYGTMHVICKNQLIISDEVTTALYSTSKIVLEMDVSKQMQAVKYIVANSTSKDSLSLGMSLQEKESLRKQLAAEGVELDKVEMLRPYIISTMIMAKALPDCAHTSVEEALLKLAKKKRLEKDYLETMQQQLTMIDASMNKEYLIASLDSTKSSKSEMQKLMNLYLKQSLSEIQEMMYETDEFSETFVKTMLIDRNKNWVTQLPEIIDGETAFFAIGAAHLIGDNGLISLLRNEGYTLTPIFNK